MDTRPGLRERKKRQTRERIRETAMRMFMESGFDNVKVADIARGADVSEGTVFNYFPTKEDLVFAGMEGFEADLIDGIRARAPGESVLAAFARFFSESAPMIAASSSAYVIAGARIISHSVTLQRKEHEITDAYTRSLAALIAEDTAAPPDDVEPWVAANALMGVHRAMLDYSRRQAVGGRTGTDLARDVAARAERAFARLGAGLADYGARPQADAVSSKS
ncbi:MAG TPA: TetR/AcrR family transcriptional regulator [Trebonia sp.]|jgi:AcrR family transcriptional regulator|nr:TetR/AcrR family transcriptional regulator [Trebonia sp.]